MDYYEGNGSLQHNETKVAHVAYSIQTVQEWTTSANMASGSSGFPGTESVIGFISFPFSDAAHVLDTMGQMLLLSMENNIECNVVVKDFIAGNTLATIEVSGLTS